jgi:hypothetical protein
MKENRCHQELLKKGVAPSREPHLQLIGILEVARAMASLQATPLLPRVNSPGRIGSRETNDHAPATGARLQALSALRPRRGTSEHRVSGTVVGGWLQGKRPELGSTVGGNDRGGANFRGGVANRELNPTVREPAFSLCPSRCKRETAANAHGQGLRRRGLAQLCRVAIKRNQLTPVPKCYGVTLDPSALVMG